MIYKIDKNCILYYQYIKELESNFAFEDRIQKLCKITGRSRSDLAIKIECNRRAFLNITWKDGEPVDFDFSGININDLNITPREYHESNINKYLDKKVAAKLKAPLNYEYFLINTALFIELPDLADVTFKFRVNGLELLNEQEDIAITYARNMVQSLIEDVSYVY
ncbi:hypothetical protein [Ruminococcus albus]|uniref:Uncharacterized protein n=1 Tax=Ruminococcus albus (strain ATCC 27210 / DSM 20455 / JCM 14654 / NCDO 2250 / 7) TaxID=697329 RepID=E6UJY2_RUMA7|nr:hypothetical protein [Ruminococcus albus]ADU23978.1 hypothetical protein Rumal_3536 [Ruminococcus albus 7 = DSM 20455]